MGIRNIGLVLALFLGFLFLDGLFLCVADHHEITFDVSFLALYCLLLVKNIDPG